MVIVYKILKGLLCVIAIIVLAGCTKTEMREGPAPGMRVENSHPYAPGIRMNSVAILDRSLQEWYILEKTLKGPVEHGKVGKIAVESAGARRSPTGTLEVWTTLRNRTNYPLQIEGRVQFFDAEKAPKEGPTAWQRLMLPANSVASYSEFSTNVKDIAYYYIEIREGR